MSLKNVILAALLACSTVSAVSAASFTENTFVSWRKHCHPGFGCGL